MKKILSELGAVTRSVVVLVLVGFAGMSALSACGWFKSDVKIAEQALVDCGKQDVTVGTLLADVTVALENGGDWRATLAALEKEHGPEALACAVRAADAVIAAHSGKSTGELSPAVQRGMSYLDERGFRFK